MDALFAALSYLDAFCVSDYFPALVGLDLDGHERVVRGVMRTLGRLHDPVVEERVEEWRRLRKAGERRNPPTSSTSWPPSTTQPGGRCSPWRRSRRRPL